MATMVNFVLVLDMPSCCVSVRLPREHLVGYDCAWFSDLKSRDRLFFLFMRDKICVQTHK